MTTPGGQTSKAQRIGLQFKHCLDTEHMFHTLDGYLCEIRIAVTRAQAIIKVHYDDMLANPDEVPDVSRCEAALLEIQGTIELIEDLQQNKL